VPSAFRHVAPSETLIWFVVVFQIAPPWPAVAAAGRAPVV
jgi:hypothetical protein